MRQAWVALPNLQAFLDEYTADGAILPPAHLFRDWLEDGGIHLVAGSYRVFLQVLLLYMAGRYQHEAARKEWFDCLDADAFEMALHEYQQRLKG